MNAQGVAEVDPAVAEMLEQRVVQVHEVVKGELWALREQLGVFEVALQNRSDAEDARNAVLQKLEEKLSTLGTTMKDRVKSLGADLTACTESLSASEQRFAERLSAAEASGVLLTQQTERQLEVGLAACQEAMVEGKTALNIKLDEAMAVTRTELQTTRAQLDASFEAASAACTTTAAGASNNICPQHSY